MSAPRICWDPNQRIVLTHADDDVRVIENVAGHDTSRTVELVDPGPLREEIASLRADLAGVERDPFGPHAVFRGGNHGTGCPCAVPTMPCREFEGWAETGAFCPCCGWNEAAHDLVREHRRRRIQRWRNERRHVVTVRQQRSGPAQGLWVARSGRRSVVASDHPTAVGEACRLAQQAGASA